jgi:hypothetical protein
MPSAPARVARKVEATVPHNVAEFTLQEVQG